MPLGPQHVAPVGFVLSGTHPEGTCFVVRATDPLMPSRTEYYMLTARHVVYQENGQRRPDLSVRFREYGGAKVAEWPEQRWLGHADDEIDLAIAPFDPQPTFDIGSINLNTRSINVKPGDVVLGADVFYVGLFTAADYMGAEGVPMVRSGTVGAVMAWVQPDRSPGPFHAHLIDCRSYGGFSGSPVWLQEPLPDAVLQDPHVSGTLAGQPLPETMKNREPRFGEHVERILHKPYSTTLLGLLIFHWSDESKKVAELASNMGVGIVVPTDRILELLTHPTLESERVTDRKIARENAPDVRARRASASAAGDDYTKGMFLGDLSKVSKRVKRRGPEA